MVLAGGGDAGLVGDHDKLAAVAPVQLAQQPADMSLNRGDAEVQVRADLGIRQPGGDLLEHFAFAAGELRERVVGGRDGARPASELGDQAPGDARRQQRVAAGDDPDGIEQLLGRVSLSTNPLAPLRNASKTCSSSSKVVTMRIRGSGT